MSSRADMLKKNFTTDQIAWLSDWLTEHPPETKALTDKEAMVNAARLLFGAGQYKTVDEKKKLAELIGTKIPTLSIDELAGVADGDQFKEYTDKDGNKVSAGRQFFDAYFGGEKDKDKRSLWRTRIKSQYGDNGWELAKKVLQNTANNAMMADIEKGRQEILEGDAEDQGVTDWGASALWGLFAPRVKKAIKEGRKVGASEILGDIASDALYGIPAANIAKPFQVAAGRLPGVAANILSKGASMGAQFAAPGAIYGVDKALGNETDWRDPLLGGLANMGVNKAIGPMLGRGLAVLNSKISQRLPRSIRETLEGVVSPRQRAMNLIREARTTMNEMRGPYSDALRAFDEGIPSRGIGVFDEAGNVLDIEKAIKVVTPEVKKYLDMQKKADKYVRKINAQTPESPTAIHPLTPPEEFLAIQLADKLGGDKDVFLKTIKADKLGGDKDVFLKTIKAHPELMTLFKKEPGPGLFQVGAAFGVNKYGNDKHGGDYAAQAISGGAFDSKEFRKEQEKERRKKATSVEAASILAPMSKDSALSEEDRKWLGKIADNPDIVRGMAEGSSQAFRNWYLLRGQDLLRNTQYFRATPEVEDVWKK